jgi:predicted component of viral defense system (DUF524 family)
LEVRAPVLDAIGEAIGEIVLSTLPGRRDVLSLSGSTPRVNESGRYRYSLNLKGDPAAVQLEPGAELFSFDTETRLSGRFEPKQHVGAVRLRVTVPGSGAVGTVEVDVAPTKLEYASEYQRMLNDVAEVATEALLQGFAPAALTLEQDAGLRSELLYQQFAFLSARLASREVRDALALIVANPHRAWQTETELQSASRPLPGSSTLTRALMRPGRRAVTNGRLRVVSVPAQLERHRTEASFDSIPNRFVKHALERWRAIAQRLLDLLSSDPDVPGPVRRGRQVARELQAQIDDVLAAPLFREIGPLGVFPSANQVLHKQHGYREIFRTFALAEVGASLSLDLDLEDVFSASQRNVATLYEYWAFLQLVEAVGAVCGERRTVEALAVSSDQLSLGFKQGAKSSVQWETAATGRRLVVEVFFNRSFRSSRDPSNASSWSRAMRPDCSLRVRPRSGLPDAAAESLDVWVHFDAKYRVERAREQFDSRASEDESAALEAEVAERLSGSKREDLLKMHAYRDAIRGSAGAYVLFPGDDGGAPFREFSELLPGIGAFALRPQEGDVARGRPELEAFLRGVIDHVADQASQDERYRYWRGVVRTRPELGSAGKELPRLATPPRDARVLCARLVTDEEVAWTTRMRTYCMSAGGGPGESAADSEELVAEWLLIAGRDGVPQLWLREGAWYVQTVDQLAEAGFPLSASSAYLCAAVRLVAPAPRWLEHIRLEMLGVDAELIRVSCSWADVLAASQ